MTNMRRDTIYIGNIMQRKNNEVIILEKDVFLIYDDKGKCFYPLDKTLNYFVDLDLNQNLTDLQKRTYQKIIAENKLTISSEEETYIDIESLRPLEDKRKNTR